MEREKESNKLVVISGLESMNDIRVVDGKVFFWVLRVVLIEVNLQKIDVEFVCGQKKFTESRHGVHAQHQD